MDNATRAAWPKIEERCPWVTVSPCEAHVSDLELEDICKLPYFKCIVKEMTDVRKFVRNHQYVHAPFKESAKKLLVVPGATRMATVKIAGDSVLQNMDELTALFASQTIYQEVSTNMLISLPCWMLPQVSQQARTHSFWFDMILRCLS